MLFLGPRGPSLTPIDRVLSPLLPPVLLLSDFDEVYLQDEGTSPWIDIVLLIARASTRDMCSPSQTFKGTASLEASSRS